MRLCEQLLCTWGSTACCTFDSLEALGPIGERLGLWVHVDAAYAGGALICDEFHFLAAGIEVAFSKRN